MKKLIYILVICFLSSLIGIGAPQAAENKSGDTKSINIMELLQKMQVSSWQERNKMLSEIRSNIPGLSDAEKTLLIEIFDKESRFYGEYVQKLKDEGLTLSKAMDRFDREYNNKGYFSYIVDFASLASSLKDTRVIPGLLRGLNNYGGAILPSHITSIGKDIIPPLIDLVNSKERVLKDMAFFLLTLLVKAPMQAEDYSLPDNIAIKDAELLEKLKTIFINALHDEDPGFRRSAIYGLEAFPEQEVIEALEEVAKNDPHYYMYDGKKKYSVRREARSTIRILKEKIQNK